MGFSCGIFYEKKDPNMATQAKQMGLSVADIITLTGLSEQEIEKL
ncbi:hypothetical protein SAMN05421780_105177 [Flexibacter flexilis DSM 6793]|uniref:Transposase n=1 Tax=Flexibacter flexilis DSM 6793 TaxID=927664 RepID=A0A1I1JB00_9BACT|nr:hypothetical protein [Flexibacter flexilis]SFC42610.1 hypothetical protein SAMN05421780_105177 [Flexibacter flexilis DSM 6793]